MRLGVDDERLAYWCPRAVDRSRAELRLRRFSKPAIESLGFQVGPLANVRSSAGCALVLATDSPWIAVALGRLRHHQPVPCGIDLEVIHPDGRRHVTASTDLHECEGEVPLRLATGLERGGGVAELWLWLPVISTVTVAGVELPDGATVAAVELPEPRWLAIGDSLTQGFVCQQPTQTWVHRLQRRWDLPAWNLGVGGARIEPGLFAEALAAREWELVTVGLGSNHAWRDEDLAIVVERTTALARALTEGGHRRVVWLLPPWKPLEEGLGPREFMGVPLDAAAAERVATTRNQLCRILADFPTIEVVADLLPHDHRLYPDGLHPSALGMARMAEALDGVMYTEPARG